ncbi:phosphoribosylglycinamide formyltransferase [Paenibacillus agaridevorans]|uniref:Phosphoribosylglycinamide formyltransferase n=1 Tax=Paenibacillus agaridevorans TaxID=171404 RepID=A0A2R5F2S0_9BACL|nr:phosphoribosylglycinamide formyltransferase [Paenibacillus agaridevorans]GBG10171.1 phosphoribosylglycinamide formyltransferase [Paenibacillus agaridevorans]
MAPLRIAVFASGQGTNFQAIADAVREGKLDVTIELLVCDKPSAPVVERASRAGVDAFVFKPKDYPNREAYETEIVAELTKRGVELIVLAGYMRILTPTIVEPYYGRMINVHPSLLPAFPGVNAMGQALDYGVKVTGVTVHYVDGGLDSGPIIAQVVVPISDGEGIDTLSERIQAVERELLPNVVGAIAAGRVKLDGRQVTVS